MAQARRNKSRSVTSVRSEKTRLVRGAILGLNGTIWLAGFRSGFYSKDHYHGNGLFQYFFFFQGNSKQQVFKKRNYVFSSQQYNDNKRNLVLNVKGYRSKFADRRRRYEQSPNGVRSLKETMPYDKQLSNVTCDGTGEYCPEVLAERTERSEIRTATTLGQFSPVPPSHSVNKRLRIE